MTAIQAITLSELARKVNHAVEETFSAQSFWVLADVTNHTFKANSNYHYFELVEKDLHSNNLVAKFSGKAWGEASRRIVTFEQVTGQVFRSNIQVLIRVAVQFHQVYGLQLGLIDIDPSYTLGVLAQQRQETLQRLVTEDPDNVKKVADRYITRNNQLQLNRVIQRVAVIASEISAGLQDFNHTLENNTRGYRFHTDYYFTSVQGDLNAKHMLQQIIAVFESRQQYDAVAIIRGGGSQTDFLIFDNFHIGRAVARFPIPVITGIGHQKNETIVDLMAHSPTKTPTQAAEFIIARNQEFESDLLSFQQSIIIRSQQVIAQRHQLLSRLDSAVVNRSRDMVSTSKSDLVRVNQVITGTAKNVINNHQRRLFVLAGQVSTRPRILVNGRQCDLVNIGGNLRAYGRQYMVRHQLALQHFSSIISLMSPANILNKGFAIVKANGVIITDPAQVEPGSTISVILGGVEIITTVISKQTYHGNDIDL